MVRCLSYLNSMSDIVYKNIKFQFIQKNNTEFPLRSIPLTDKIEAGADLV